MTYIHYGWPASPYSAKSRAALRCSGLDWSEAQPHGLTFAWLQSHIGRNVIPVLRTPEGDFIQDSSRIIDLIARRSDVPMTPPHGLGRVLALWFEVFADEWMIYPAMYFRWRYRGGDFNYMMDDFGRCALPGAPRPVRRQAGKAVASAMSRYLPIMGVNDHTGPAIEAVTLELLDRLTAVLEEAPFVLGQTPCIADFALYGPIAAHIGRDPWSAHVVDDRPALRRWVQALDVGSKQPEALRLRPSQVSRALHELLSFCFAIAMPAWLAAHELVRAQWRGPGTMLRRRVGEFEASLIGPEGAVTHPHKLTAVSVWKMQRPIGAFARLNPTEREEVTELFADLNANALARLRPLDGFTLESIQWKQDKTSFGAFGSVIERLTPLFRGFPPRRPVHPRKRGPVDALG